MSVGRVHAGQIVTVHVTDTGLTLDVAGEDLGTIRRTTTTPVRNIKADRPTRKESVGLLIILDRDDRLDAMFAQGSAVFLGGVRQVAHRAAGPLAGPPEPAPRDAPLREDPRMQFLH